MTTEVERGYCQRNLKPAIALLVVLVLATVAWAVMLRQSGGFKRARRGAGPPAARAKPPQAGVAGAAAVLTPAATWEVDAVTLATPNGGIKLIAQTVPTQPAADFVVTPGAAAAAQAVPVALRDRTVFNKVAATILPAVVSIHGTRNRAASPAREAEGNAAFVNPFDGIPDKFALNKAFESVGSGVIIDSRGFILTNYHVISQATDVLVTVAGTAASDFPAAVVAVDPTVDLALVKLFQAPALPEARLGDSDAVQVGDVVLAFGSPFGLDQTVTQGIISNKRENFVVGEATFGAMLQTDAPINRGSSGGPLVNLQAEVVGINSAIYGPNGVFNGTGFAIPINRAKLFLAQNSRVLQQ